MAFDLMSFGGKESDGDKAAYNQAAPITIVLGELRKTFISCMMATPDNLTGAVEAMRNTLNVIAGKVENKDISPLSEGVYDIEDNLPEANTTYKGHGGTYYKNVYLRKMLKRKIEEVYREIERLMDKKGYGMPSLDDPRFAVLQR